MRARLSITAMMVVSYKAVRIGAAFAAILIRSTGLFSRSVVVGSGNEWGLVLAELTWYPSEYS